MFNCIKTGFYADSGDGSYLYGDAFAMDGTHWPDEPSVYPSAYLLLRITSRSVEPPPRIHIQLISWARWFDEMRRQTTSRSVNFPPCSTLIANPGQWSWLGYEGVAP